MARTCLTIILAAGEGSRMKSSTPKVLHKVAERSLLGHVMAAAQSAGGESHAVVVGKASALVEAEARAHSSEVDVYLQAERLGTAHAVLAAKEAIERRYDDILVLFGDTPLIRAETLLRLRRALELGADIVVLGFRTDEPTGYGRLIEKDGELVAIREHKDASAEELAIKFCNGGIMAFSGAQALSLISSIGNENVKNEYYLTDAVQIAKEKGLKVQAIEADENEVLGINDRYELSRIEAIWQSEKRETLMRSGVTMHAPDSVHFCYDTEIEPDAILEPNLVFGPKVRVETGATIKAFSHLEGASVASGSIVGPFARLRPGAELQENSKVGNFCEVKKATIEKGAKVNHLTYIGDARVGSGSNIGAGTVTCNYDGLNKHFTDIGEGTFVGTNSALVAPVKIGDGAYIGSGSVITENVPDNALAIARGKQVNKEDRAIEIRKRLEAFKAAKSK